MNSSARIRMGVLLSSCLVMLFLFVGVFSAFPQLTAMNHGPAAVSGQDVDVVEDPDGQVAFESGSGQEPGIQDALEADGQDASSRNPYSYLEEGGYEPEVALVSVDSYDEAVALSEQLLALDYVSEVPLNEACINAGFLRVQLTAGTNAVEAVGQMLDAGIAAEPDEYLYVSDDDLYEDPLHLVPAYTPNDPYIADGKLWGNEAISVYDAWNLERCGENLDGTAKIKPVSVVVIDTGCDWSHDDFKDSATGTSNITVGYNAYNAENNPTAGTDLETMSDPNGHGTHVCGTIAARANNGIGVAGVSYNARVIPVQTMKTGSDGKELSTSAITMGIQWAIDNKSAYNIKVINMSLGSASRTTSLPLDSPESGAQNRTMVKNMKKAYDAGILVVCAAGNDANNKPLSTSKAAYWNYPSDYAPEAVGVIAVNKNMVRASFSNYNLENQTTKDISAPGVSIQSTWTRSGGSSWISNQGTSMASPHVAGVAALLFSAMPNATAQQVSDCLFAGANDLGNAGWDLEFGYGCVNAYRSLQLATAKLPVSQITYLDELPLSVVDKLGTPVDIAAGWNWTSSDANVGTLDATTGTLTATGTGSTTLTATLEGFSSISASTSLTVNKLDLNSDKVTISAIPTQGFLGSAVTPDFTVSYKRDANTPPVELAKGTDYTVSFAGNDAAGEATVTITGIGNCTGTKTSSFVIDKASIADAELAPIDSRSYTGSPVTVDFALTYNGKPLSSPADYTVSYENNVNPGTATATITGTGSFVGTKTVTFSITANMDGVTVDSIPATAMYTGSEIKPVPVVSHHGVRLIPGTDYEVSYSGDLVSVGTNAAFVTITGKGDYQESVTRAFSIAPRPLSDGGWIGGIDPQYLGSSAATPAVIVKVGNTTLVKGTDYDVAYSNNTSVGTAGVTVTGKGNYTGTLTTSFQILGTPIANARVTASDQGYSGLERKPAVTVVLNGTTLRPDVDYDVTYGNNVEVGTATITVTGKGGYSGTAYGSFKILPSVSAASVTIPKQTFTGSAITPEFKVSCGSTILTPGADYTLSFSNNVNAGTATVNIIGTGAYSGQKTVSFTIDPANLDQTSIVTSDQTYTGSNLRPKPTVTFGSLTLVEGTDYRVQSYGGNLNAGTSTASIRIVALKGSNYTGYKDGIFSIKPADINDATIGEIGAQTYAGSAVTPLPPVTFAGNALTKDVDYTISYANNTAPGSAASLTITGKGNFGGSKTIGFTISQNITAASVSVPSQTYTGSALTPAPVVTLGSVRLVEGTDYTVTYKDNVNAGTGTAVITGMGAYVGTKEARFAINRASIANAVVTAPNQTYTGTALAPVVTVTLNGKALNPDVDYNLRYANNSVAGTASIIVMGRGNYVDTAYGSFTITRTSTDTATSNAEYAADAASNGTGGTTASNCGAAASNGGAAASNGGASNGGSAASSGGSAASNGGSAASSGGTASNGGAASNGGSSASNGSSSNGNASAGTSSSSSSGGSSTAAKPSAGSSSSASSSSSSSNSSSSSSSKKPSASSSQNLTGTWVKSGSKWWFRYTTGGYPKSKWMTIDGVRYHFDKNGYMQTGWLKLGSNWYYLSGSGAMKTGWLYNGGTWYYLKPSNGAMHTGWIIVNGSRYYMWSSGAMATGWVKAGNTWYYLRPSGAMATNAWAGNYWLQANGKMATSKWVDGGRYYVGKDGAWVPNARR